MMEDEADAMLAWHLTTVEGSILFRQRTAALY